MTFSEDVRRLLFKMQEDDRWRDSKETARWWVDMGFAQDARASIRKLSPLLRQVPWMAGVYHYLKQENKNETNH